MITSITKNIGRFVGNQFQLHPYPIICLLLCSTWSTIAFAANTWSYHQETDRQTNENFSYALSPVPAHNLYDDIKLTFSCRNQHLQVGLDADDLIASQGSTFDFEYQIDKNAPIKISMKTLPDSKRKAYTEQNAEQITKDLLSGESVFIRINTMIRKTLTAAIPLTDAAPSLKQVLADCNLSATKTHETTYGLAEFTADLDKLSDKQQQLLFEEIKLMMQRISATPAR